MTNNNIIVTIDSLKKTIRSRLTNLIIREVC